MIVINKNTLNTVVLTLTETTQLPNAYYLIEFISTITKENATCLPTDISTHTGRYNSFEIVERENANGIFGEVYLPHEGFYNYKVYAQLSSANLNPANALELVETGLAYVVGPSSETHTYTPTTNNTFIYNG